VGVNIGSVRSILRGAHKGTIKGILRMLIYVAFRVSGEASIRTILRASWDVSIIAS
jgi:hypothetical protein